MRAVAREKKQFGERVRRFRAAKEWSREVAAEKIGVHAVHIARIELGNANVTLTTVVAIARAFGIETKALFGDE
jgi:transcriptional regulator with XRE-family HTH domain